MSQLSYLEMVEDHGQVLVANGVVRTDQVDTLTGQRDLQGRGVRIYALENRAATRQSLGSLRHLLYLAPRALQDVLSDLFESPTAQTGPDFVLEAFGNRRRFASLDLQRHRVEVLDRTSARSLDELLSSWARVKGSGSLLVEVEASRESLEVLVRGSQRLAGDEDADALEAPPHGVFSTTAVQRTARPALPAETTASAARRAALAQDWLDADSVSALLGSRAENRSQLPNRLRREGRLFGVWIVSENRYRFPPWQFHPTTHQVLPEMRELLALLRSAQGIAGGRQTSGWEEIEWLCAPHALLDKQTPADLLRKAPEQVLDVARREFTEDRDARW